MDSLQIIFVPMLFVSISPLFDGALGDKTSEKSGKRRRALELEEMDYEWERILEQVQKYTAEQNEYKTSQDGWLEIYKRQKAKKQTREKICHFLTLKEVKENILQIPRAKLFTEADRSGNVEVYDFKSPTWNGGCSNLEAYAGQIKSVDSEGKCVRLFSKPACEGWSHSIYPGSTIIPDAKLSGVFSIGPCVSNEFEHSLLIKSSPSQLEKLPSALDSFANVHDLIGDVWTRPESFTSVDFTSSNPVHQYLLGPGNRVEALRGEIYARHLKSPETAEIALIAGREESFYSKLELGKRDEPGFAIPLELGGPADQIYNVFPLNVKQAVNFKGKIVPLVKKWLTDYPNYWALWSVNFIYKNSNTTRPSGYWYRINCVGNILYGFVMNLE